MSMWIWRQRQKLHQWTTYYQCVQIHRHYWKQ